MNTLTLSTLLPQICRQLFENTPKSVAGQAWFLISNFWDRYWLWIIIGLGLWIIYELLTRNGRWHYNSKNGFSPGFNRFIGSGTYILIQTIIAVLFVRIFNSTIYCYPWPYIIHLLSFVSTRYFLKIIRFWIY